MAHHAPARRMSLENAELAKISVNSFVTMKITFANMLAALCEAIPGADVDVVTHALGSDRRIGSRYLTGVDAPALGPRATDAVNAGIPERIVARVAPLVPAGGTVGVLGLAYKPASHVVEAAQGVALVDAFLARGLRVVAVAAGPDRRAPDRRRSAGGRRGRRRRRHRHAGSGVRVARLGGRARPPAVARDRRRVAPAQGPDPARVRRALPRPRPRARARHGSRGRGAPRRALDRRRGALR
jgi:hypothetical protein